MYKIIKDILNTGDFDLTTLLKKIKALWLEEDITDSQYEELCALARKNAGVIHSIDVFDKLADLDRRVSAIENGCVTTEPEEYSEYIVGKWYYRDDKVSFEGKNYVCTAPENVVCVWSPKDYPAYWKEEV